MSIYPSELESIYAYTCLKLCLFSDLHYYYIADGRLCNTDLENLRRWQLNPNLTDVLANYLTAQGEQDMRLLARRLQSEFPEILRPDPQTISFENYKV